MIKITEEDRKLLESFPKYNNKPFENYVGTRDYWENVFKTETNRDTELHEAFSMLHEEIVDKVIQFCKEHNLTDVDEFSVHADGIQGSIEFGRWCPCTDSSMRIIKATEDEHGWVLPNRDEPFLYEI